MNWQHFRAFVWLRWRLLANGWRRGGQVNFVLTMIFTVAALAASMPLFAGAFVLGLYGLDEVKPVHLLYIWDGLACVFVFIWCIGLLTELQRSESLALSKFLHLPVSLKGAFVINYLSSLVSLTTVLFVPVLAGLGLGLALSKGLLLLVALPLSAAFLLMVTALSYQFQGWLASLMSNPRRRRTVIVGVTAMFILVAQLPQLLNIFAPWHGQGNRVSAQRREIEDLDRDFQAKKLDAQEHDRRKQEIQERHQREDQFVWDKWQRAIRLLNWVLPIGWLPLGVMEAAQGNLIVPPLAFVALTAVGAGSLWRSYRTTVNLYQGQFTAQKSGTARVTAAPPPTTAGAARTKRNQLLELHLPGFSEPVSAVALAGFRSLVRSPEAKMMLLTPLILTVIAGGAVFRQPHGIPDAFRPLMAYGGMVMVLFGMLQLMSNQFGFDRDGFRVLVLSAASRRDILMGKNLAFFPLAAGMAGLLMIVLEVVCPLRIDHLIAMLPQFISMYLMFCVLTNMTSIYAPIYIAAGAMKPANPKFLVVLLQLAIFTIFFPLTQFPTLVPLGLEALLEHLGWTSGIPIFLLLTLAECVVLAFVYRWILAWQGGLLQRREQQILQTVTKGAT